MTTTTAWVQATVHSYRDRTVIDVMRFADTKIDYFIKYVHQFQGIDGSWEVRFFDTNGHVIEINDKVEDVITMNEEELFQASCVEKFDVYLIQAGMRYLIEQTRFGIVRQNYNLTLEY